VQAHHPPLPFRLINKAKVPLHTPILLAKFGKMTCSRYKTYLGGAFEEALPQGKQYEFPKGCCHGIANRYQISK
jgi:hypothetical protein